MKLRDLLKGTSAHPLPPPPPPQCAKITTRGTRCKLPPPPGETLCVMHKASEAEKLHS